jgi:hypothetical protein
VIEKVITYEDLDGNTVTEKAYFHFTKTQFMEFLFNFGDSEATIEANLANIVKNEDTKTMFAQTKDLILAAYGVRSEDGRGFNKSEDLRIKFANSLAFDELFQELGTDEKALNEWMAGVMPKGLQVDITSDTVKTALAELKGLPEVKDVPLPPVPNPKE